MVEGTFGLTLPPPTESLCPSFQGRLMIINLGLLLDHPQCEQDLGAGLGHPVLDDPRRRGLLHEPPMHGVRVLARGGGGHRLLGCNSGG